MPAAAQRRLFKDDDIVLLGLFDLLLTHEAHTSFHNTVLDFLHTTRFHHLYRYLVNGIVASRRKELAEALTALAATEQDRVKAEILAQALDPR